MCGSYEDFTADEVAAEEVVETPVDEGLQEAPEELAEALLLA